MASDAKRAARSPYQRYGKSPHRYSPSLEAWRRCVQDHRPEDAAEHDRAWKRQWVRPEARR